jgi:hypothetical protein
MEATLYQLTAYTILVVMRDQNAPLWETLLSNRATRLHFEVLITIFARRIASGSKPLATTAKGVINVDSSRNVSILPPFAKRDHWLEQCFRHANMRTSHNEINQKINTVAQANQGEFLENPMSSMLAILPSECFGAWLRPFRLRKPQKSPFSEGLYTKSVELGARKTPSGNWILRLRKEEEQGDKESEADQTEERPTRDQGDMCLLREADFQDW